MQCPHPISIINKKEPYKYYGQLKLPNYIFVPCGKCPVCLDNRREDWFVRLQEELRTTDLPLFVTLTYADEFLPHNKENIPVVVKSDCQNFFKRLRKSLESGQYLITFKYFLASEYGSEGKRPHYHVCFFFYFQYSDDVTFCYITDYVKMLITKHWNKGFVDIGQLKPGGINYVTKYIHKKKEPPAGACKTFQLQSQGMGINYITCTTYDYHKSDIVKHNKYVDHNRTYRLPRYYREKIYEEEEKEQLLINHYERTKKEYEEQPPITDKELWDQFIQKQESQLQAKEYQIRKRLKMSTGLLDE